MDEPIVFNGNPLDRAGNLRRDPDWLAGRLNDPESRFLPIYDLKALIRIGYHAELAWCTAGVVRPFLEDGARHVVLGLGEGVCHFAIDVSGRTDPTAEPFAGLGKFIDARSIAPSLPAGHAGILAQARAMLGWHARHPFCAVCGSPSEVREGGYNRQCSNADCGASHFPRTDPVVIMLVLAGDECLLGRSRHFPAGSYSALAGFVEPGESMEEAVRREVEEEAGITVGAVRYIASQSWPFPSSLMIGCFSEAKGKSIVVDPHELEEARWFHRDQVAEMLTRNQRADAPRMPPPLSLAHQLALHWIAGG